MADVLIACKHCGAECKVSEFAATDEIACPKCNAKIERPAKNDGPPKSRLSLKKGGSDSRLIDQSEDELAQQAVTREQEALAPQALDRVHAIREKVSAPKAILQWAVFLVVGGIMFWLLYNKGANSSFQEYYEMLRAVGWGIASIVLIIVAFQDSTLQGIFCLLLWPYAIYYVFSRADSYLLRGLVMGLLVGICAEVYYLGDQSVVADLQAYLNNVVNGGGALIDAASAPPPSI